MQVLLINRHHLGQYIKRLFHLGNVKSHSKPVKYNKTVNSQKDENEAQKLPNSLNIKNYVKLNKYYEDIYSGAIIPNDQETRKIFGNYHAQLTFDFNKIPEKTLIKIFSEQKDFRNIFDYVVQSITYAKLDYFKKVMKEIIEECKKKEETKRDFRNFVCNYTYVFLNEQINALLEY